MIRIDNATRAYGDLVAVRGVSAEIARGEVVGLLGHNGAGKTTLMKLLTGYLEPTSGTLSVGGRDVVTDRLNAQRLIGYLPESAPLYPEMLVQEYLLMMAELRGVPADKARDAVARAAAATGLHGRMVQPIGTLSKGYRQRVGLAQAIVHDPAVLVLDEPTNGLDPVQIQSIRELIRTLAEHTTVLLSTHILQEVEAVCDRVLILIDGTLAEDAPLADLLRSRTLEVVLAEPAEGARAALAGLPGVEAVREGHSDLFPDATTWLLDCADGPWPTPAVLELARERGWTVLAAAPQARTLDRVFRELQAARAQQGGEA